ncbi:MAG: lytic transglycosylase domain-containing protein [Acidobacteria bacterium]|nr:lytic transglycosylase domain-containing protein [Acidobacteriota bacterium]
MRIERHEPFGERVRLHTSATGFVDLPADQVTGFEPILETATPPTPVIAAAPAPKPIDERPLEELIEELAATYDLHPALIHSIIAAESNYQADAVSHKGAIGLMQLMPDTARELAVDPHRPDENVMGGVRYLRAMLDRYRGKPDQLLRALAAYNAGPGAVDRYDGLPPYAETQDYVAKVVRRFLRMADAGSSD